MNQRPNILRGRPWLVLLVLLGWLLPQRAAATYVDEPDNYTIMLGGTNIVYFTAPAYDTSDGDTWVALGTLKVTPEGGTEQIVFQWSSKTDIDNSDKFLSCNFSTPADGFFDVTLGNQKSTFRLTKSNGGWQALARNSDDKTFEFAAEWVVPYNLLGKKLTFTWDVSRDGNGRTAEKVKNLKSVTINMPAASAKLQPFLSAPMLNPNNPGKLELPWFLASDSITKAYFEYDDADGKHHQEDINNMNSGIIMLDANVPYRKLRVVCNYKERGDKGVYEIEGVSSSTQNMTLIHAPIGLTARYVGDRKAKVELQWTAPYPNDEDLVPSDFFDIQRSLTGREEDFVTIGQLLYAKTDNKTDYSFTDSTLVDDLLAEMLTSGGTLENLTYRVRRTITQDWGWGEANNCATSTRCPVDNLHLMRIADYTARWEDETAHTVRVTWNYADEYGAVWDERAQMVLRVISKNDAGEVVEEQTHTLDQNERALRYKVLNLERSCVHYDIDMYVDQGESPIGFGKQSDPYYFPIRSEADWDNFAKKVNVAGGKSDVNARLYADITVSGFAGFNITAPYRGIFDGNGYTLTYNTDVSVDDVGAPFRFVGNATIRNLHTAGTNETSDRWRAGLVGQVTEGSYLLIENCRSSVTINSTYDGKANHGGLVGKVSDATVAIRNSKFDGRLEGFVSTQNGGFIGWVTAKSTVVIENSFFAPAHLGTSTKDCATWACLEEGATLKRVNCYATSEYAGSESLLISSAADWDLFVQEVEKAKNEYDVNAILDADITVSSYAGGSEAAYYRGTFDGNGHTLTFNKSGVTEEWVAPFRYVGDATIKNLHTAGSISTSNRYAAGIVAWTMDKTKVNIENCHSSMELKCSKDYDNCMGGIIGRQSGADVVIRNTKFYGSFTGGDGNGGFVAWATGPVTIENCLFMPSSVNTDPKDSETWVCNSANITLTVTNSYATNDFCYLINNSSDWEDFRTALDKRGTKSVNAIMNADVTVSSSAYNFKGTFDGNGHTMTTNMIGSAMFGSGTGYTIRNLHVNGSVSGDRHISGLVVGTNGSERVFIENCWVSTNVHCNEYYAGGVVGHGGDAPHNIINCLFDGAISGRDDGKLEGDAYVGAIIGWVGAADHCVTNCLEDGNYYYFNNIGFCYTEWEKWGNDKFNSSNNFTYKDWGEVIYGGIRHSNVSDWIGRLGDGWYQSGDRALPKMTTRSLWNSVGSLSGSELAEKLGEKNWKVVDGKAVPVLQTTSTDATQENPDFSLSAGWTKEASGILVPATTTVPEPAATTPESGATNVFAISTADDWRQFRDMVEAAKGEQDVNAILQADITTDLSIGRESNTAYRGTFDGNGHTINLNISDGGNNNALFRNAKDYTIKNLRLTGSVKGGIHSAGLVGISHGGERNAIENCHVSVAVECSGSHAGGILGHGGKAGLVITNCLFDGSIKGNASNSRAGAIIGWCDDHTQNVTSNCLENGSYTLGSIGLNNSYDAGVYGNDEKSTNNWSFHDWAEANKASTLTADELATQLGSDDWQVTGGKVVPKMTTTANISVTKCDVPDFYHKNTGTIEKVLMTQTRQSSVLLQWNTDGSPIDYFKVVRRVNGEGEDKWKEVATNLDQLSYEDTSVSPLVTYEYQVWGVNDCEGVHISKTDAKVGECKHTGRVEGYVRFNDGTGAPDIVVAIIHDGQTVTTVTTDESGYFEADELSYYDDTKVTYKVSPVPAGDKDIKYERGDFEVTFDAHSNNVTLGEFTIKNGRRFSGYVMYEGTSIPVKGVNFLVNGRKMHNAKGEFVETDYDGSFSFRLVDGNNTIQAVKDGHDFTGDGWYKNSGLQSIKSDVAGIYFYDATKVTLTGRVAGGDDQGSKPLMNNLSKNNLGDSLTMVLTLEGDNTSWLVYDNLNPNRTQREEVVRHQRGGDKHYTKVTWQRKRMVVEPDPTTGEYVLNLPPVRWKVQQVYCTGYPTLFQEGQMNEVIDLTDCLAQKDTTYAGTYKDVDTITVSKPTASYNAVYNRIFHNPVEVTYRQIGYDTFDYFGDKSYYASELTGETVEVPLVYSVKKPGWPATRSDSLQAVYTFGYPVFSVERKYNILLQVAERYQYNNDPLSGAPDVVRLGGGKARMQNGMKAFQAESLLEPPVEIDSLGQARFTLKANQTTTLLTGENALKTVTFTVERDSTFIEAEPLHGFVLNMFPIGASRDVMNEGKPILYDVLRDPPGAYSTNTLAKGATINNTYMMNLSLTAGLYTKLAYGEKLEVVSATVVAPSGNGTAVGPINISDKESAEIDALMYNGNGSKAFSHTMVVGNNISTSGDPSMVGADADLYIGTVQNVVVTPMSAIRAVNDSMYNAIIARTAPTGGMVSEVGKKIEYGTVVEIASGKRIGKDGKEEKFHLIRDVALGYGPKIESQFVYSQKQLLTQLIPAKAKEIVDMMFCGSKTDAQAVADRTKKAVYLSLRLPTDSMFAVVNSKKPEGHAYNTTIEKAEKGINYLVVLPTDADESKYSDEVAEKYEVIKTWVDMIAKNEAEKMNARDLMTNYDVAGAAGVNYSETFDASYSDSWSNFFPIATEVDYFGAGKGLSMAASAVGIAYSIASAIGLSLQEMKTWKVPDPKWTSIDVDNGVKSGVRFAGKLFQWSVFPVASYTSVGADSEARSYNRTETFTIATDPASHLNVDVYRARYSYDDKKDVNVANIFTNDNFNRYYSEVSGQVEKSLKNINVKGPRGFIFRTRGGSTQNPWEDQRLTKFYSPGSLLDARTLKICNPKIRLDKQSVSGVSVDDAAHFTVFVSNESEKPEATDGLSVLQVFVPDMMNPLGAKISINGQPMTTGGITVTVIPGTETALQMEVRPGQGFDYEKLFIGVMSPTDPENTYALTSFDVHFLREAGGVNIAVPGDKWVLNTMAQKDSKRGWYIPVTINGFDRHQHNFDHIEFQYKESQRGDDAWTNLCSFYAKDSLMAKANGVRKLIPENGNIVTEFYGDGWVIERSYDLRAVLFCRNGSDFLTTPSKVISGIKDTRRPQLFGTPEPKNGLLMHGDDIVFSFSEDIEYNNLSAITNFEVKGEVNNNSLSEMVSVQFDGKGSVESEAKRNFGGKDLTIDMMVKPAQTGRDMPLFSHGTNGQKLQLWLTDDYRLRAVVNEQTYTSEKAISTTGFCHVAMVLNQTDSLLTLFNGGQEIGRARLNATYSSTGTLIFGRTNETDRTQSQYYEGRMMEARLWYSALDAGLIGTTYGGRQLTGFEKNLVDYYPMNEGSGKYTADRTQGANAQLIEASWAIPQGLSLKLDKADKGVLLDRNAINRTADHDYTLMFWFRTDAEGRGTLLSNGRGLKEDNGAESLFRIGFDADKLTYRSNGFTAEVPGDWSDGNWHNFAMTVNRARNVANIYMDKNLVTTFEADSIGGISGGYPLIGATRYDVLKDNGDVETLDGDDALTGNVDELMFFAQALPQQLISTYTTKSPNGDEAGLLTYLSFDRQERQKDNSIELVPYVYSKKLYLDDKGEPRYQLDPLTKEPTDTLVRDYVFVGSPDEIMKHFDNKTAAPVVPYEEVKNLKFSFIGKGNQVLVELDEPAARLNHRNIYVTLRDVEDLNGNTMASPQTACYYVNSSNLEWMLNSLDYTCKYGESEQVDLPFFNHGAEVHTYTIENCPKWLTLDHYTDVIAPLNAGYITATVSKDLNVGTYNEIIYLTDEDGITEPFYLNLTVEGETPDWAESVSGDMLQNSMNIVGQVYLNGELDTDTRDIVGAFDDNNVCHGFANISHSDLTGENALYLTVYDNNSSIGGKLNFVLWQYSTGRELLLSTKDTINFVNLAMLGSDTPVRFSGGESYVQRFNLKKGWNWVSINVHSEELEKLDTLLYNMPWKDGDMLTDMNSDLTLLYNGSQWILSGDTTNVGLTPKNSYAIYVQEEGMNLLVSGSVIKEEADRTIQLENGWNGIGYTPMTNLTVETALSDYYDDAQTGDVIKSQTEFAYFTKTGNTGRWRGSLKYMKPGEGYLMLHKAMNPAEFRYPFYEPGSAFLYSTAASRAAHGNSQQPKATTPNSPASPTTLTTLATLTTMSVSAVVEGFELEEGDFLVAITNDEVVGRIAVSATIAESGATVLSGSSAEGSEPLYLTVGGERQLPVRFAIEREGDLVAYTPETMNYRANAIVGTPDEPKVLTFVEGSPTGISIVRAEMEEGQWYTTNGMKLQKAPTRPGLYIYNGQKVIIRKK